MTIRVVVGIILIITGIVFYGAASYSLYNGLSSRTIAETQAARMTETCRKQVALLGKVSMRPNRGIEVDLGEVKEPRLTLADMTAIVALCPFQPMIEACLGTSCRTPETALPRAFVRLGEPRL